MADLNASDILAADWARRAREILASTRTPEAREFKKTSIGRRGPSILEDRDLRSPDQVAADIILGRGTGRLAEDILTGLTPLPGAITEARGGESGILDWVPGTGLVKGAVIAAPKAANILKNVVRTKSDDIADMVKLIAEDAVEQFRHADHVPTRDEINTTVRDITTGMDNTKGIDNLRKISGDLAESTLNRANSAIEIGRTPSFDIKMPETLDISDQSLDVSAIDWFERRRNKSRHSVQTHREFFESLPEEEKEAIRKQARDAFQSAVDEGKAAGVNDPDRLRDLGRKAYTNTRASIIRGMYNNTVDMDNIVRGSVPVAYSDDARKAQREAYAAAIELAKLQGMDSKEAKRVAIAAGARARRQSLLTSDETRAALLAQKRNEGQNIKKVYAMLSPELKEEITEAVEAERAVAKQQLIDSGVNPKKITDLANRRAGSLRTRLTRQMVKELGFKSVNDPRLAEFSQLRRDGNHVRAGQAAQILSATPETVYPEVERALPAAADVNQGYAARILSVEPEQASRLLPENEYSDADIAELLIGYGEQPTADAAFNREYAEMLMKEQGY